MERTFVETQIFKQLLDQEANPDLEREIKEELLKNPTKGSLIAGTGGIRKFRVGNKFRNKGKSGGYRVMYLDIPEQSIIYLIFIFDKDDLENISNQQKFELKN